jgi:hypothetical protein
MKMSYEIRFTGTEEQMADQAWAEILGYLGADNVPLLPKVRDQVMAESRPIDDIVNMIGMMWGISGKYNSLALKQFLLGERNI